jgi:enoyl-[acyl-carrier-protein] reductase (NADH)
MAERGYTAQVSLQMENVKKEIKTLIKTYENLALQINKVEEVQEIKEDANLLKNIQKRVKQIIDQIKIIEKKLKQLNDDFFDIKLENNNKAIDNFFEKVIQVIRVKRTQKQKEIAEKQKSSIVLEKVEEIFKKV